MKCSQGMVYSFIEKIYTGEPEKFQYCSSATNDCIGTINGKILKYAGLEDWRVPSADELISLIQCENGKVPKITQLVSLDINQPSTV